MIKVKRVYEPAEPGDGARFLVERLWPRGVKKTALEMQAWLKDVAPNDELRRWFGHDPARWDEFQRRYTAELHRKPHVLQPIMDSASRGNVTLLFSARDTEHNNAVALKIHLEHILKSGPRGEAPKKDPPGDFSPKRPCHSFMPNLLASL